MTERGGRRVIVVVLGGETSAARDAQVAYLIEGAYQEYARREDPNAAQFASLPTRRLDVQLAPGTLQANAATPLPPSPYQMYQGMVIETLSPVPRRSTSQSARATRRSYRRNGISALALLLQKTIPRGREPRGFVM